MRITLIHPSRGRVKEAVQTCDQWLRNAYSPDNIEYVLSIDNDDPSNYEEFFNATHIMRADNKSAIEAINRVAKVCTGDLIIVISDDFACEPRWDVTLLNALKGKKDFIVKTKDGLQDWIITLPILDKFYYNRFGYIYPPHIRHMFADTWMTHVADLTGRKLSVDILFEHLHYSAGKGAKDEINIRNERTWADGEAKYLEGVRNNFGLTDSEIKGTLKADFKLIQWLKERNAYVI